MEEEFMDKWSEFLTEEKNKTFKGLPFDSNGKSPHRNAREERERRKKAAGVTRKDIFPGSDGLTEEKPKNCTPGNPNHRGSSSSKGKPGTFASNDEKGSWSLSTDSSRSDCNKGKLQKLGGKKTRWTKAGKGEKGCGRDGQYLCSNPKIKKWSKDRRVAEMLVAFVDDLIEEGESLLLDEGEGCGSCIQQYLKSLNAAINASKGDLFKK